MLYIILLKIKIISMNQATIWTIYFTNRK